MRILVTIPHYYNPTGGGRYGSVRCDPRPRVRALTACLSGLHQLFGTPAYQIDIARREAFPTGHESRQLDIVICTTGGRHLLDALPLPKNLYTHHATAAEPMLLGFECQRVLRDRLGGYDYYCFLEDDLVLEDPWLFTKLAWFTEQAGAGSLLQPNRFEVGGRRKAYIDGDLAPAVTARFQNVAERPEIRWRVLGRPVVFRRPLNPHSGCYFLSARQMAFWARRPHFLDRDTSFIGPLESAATLGVMRTFRVYKPAAANADFLTVRHHGTAFLNLIGRQVRPAPRGRELSDNGMSINPRMTPRPSASPDPVSPPAGVVESAFAARCGSMVP